MDITLRKPILVGNWKLHNNITESIKLVTALKNMLGDSVGVETVVAPPFTSLYSVSVAIQETPIKLGAQNCFWEDEGPYTGEVSAPFLKDVGCDYVIVGHSERREHFGETDEIINRKIHALLNVELTPIFCIGETARQRHEKKTFEVIEHQMRRGLIDVGMHDLTHFIIAYEPVWAIGTGDTARPSQVDEVHTFIRNFLAKLYDAPTANGIRLLYGGSVKEDNLSDLLQVQHVDGVLVGSASLDPEQFSKMIRLCDAKT
jgi:triosephosphate isomerase